MNFDKKKPNLTINTNVPITAEPIQAPAVEKFPKHVNSNNGFNANQQRFLKQQAERFLDEAERQDLEYEEKDWGDFIEYCTKD